MSELLETPSSTAGVRVPIGTADHQDAHIRRITGEAHKVWSQLGELQDVQAAYTPFRACAAWNKVAHLMRTTHPEIGTAAFRDFDTKLRSAFTGLTSLHLNNEQWTQLTLPTKKGGAGLKPGGFPRSSHVLRLGDGYTPLTNSRSNASTNARQRAHPLRATGPRPPRAVPEAHR
jgi:hypothetical protein